MTKESSNDSSRHESGLSPRRAARAEREKAEHRLPVEQSSNGAPVADLDAGRSDAPARHGSAQHHAAANSAASSNEAEASSTAGSTEETTAPDTAEAARAAEAAHEAKAQAIADAATAEEAERVRTVSGERAKALEAAQRIRTQSALRARQEAIEAQRAAAERVRRTLRANAAPLRDRSAAARGTAGTRAPEAPKPVHGTDPAQVEASQARESGQPSPKTPFDQNAVEHRPVAPADTPGRTATTHDTGAAEVAEQRTALHPPRPVVGPVMPPAAGPAPREERPVSQSGSRDIEPAEADEVGHAVDATQQFEDAPKYPEYPEDGEETPPVGDIDEQPEAVYHEPEHQMVYTGHHRDPRAAGAHGQETDETLERENLFLTAGTSGREVRKARRRRRNWIVTAVLLGFCAVIFGVVLFLQGMLAKLSPEDYPAPGGEAVSFEVKQGWGQRQISRELESRDIVASDKLFLESVQLVEVENHEIHPGTYNLRHQMPALDAATILIGEPAEKVSYVAIKENTRLPQVIEEIEKSTGIPASKLNALAEDPKAFGIKSKATNLEGYLHPGEYRFALDADAKTVLKTMVDATTKKLADNGVTEADQQYHVLKVASILQAEARKDDYGTVAGALENRLHPNNTETNGLLQVDSSVIYGLDRYTLQISGAEKTDAGNPYNTYVHQGLPPTPIGSPGDFAIKAAANPTPNDYYYWVTVDTNSGETKFAKTYAEHQVYQNEFRAWCAANSDVCK